MEKEEKESVEMQQKQARVGLWRARGRAGRPHCPGSLAKMSDDASPAFHFDHMISNESSRECTHRAASNRGFSRRHTSSFALVHSQGFRTRFAWLSVES